MKKFIVCRIRTNIVLMTMVLTVTCITFLMIGQGSANAQETNQSTSIQAKMKAMADAEKQLVERRNVVLTENVEALALAAEILEMENAVKAKRTQLNAVVEKDAEFAQLKGVVVAKREEITALRQQADKERMEEFRKRQENSVQKQ